eukprot:SM000318S12232  [mRNA]  locus=s318:99304:101928:- [translate_table: standard]
MCFDPVLSPAVYGASGAIFLAWNVKRWLRSGAQDSQGWPAAPLADVQAIVHYCQLVQGAYAREPADIPARAPFVRPDDVVRFVGWPSGPVENAMCPPHFVYADAASAEVVLAIRGMRMSCPTAALRLHAQSQSFLLPNKLWTLLSNRRGEQTYAGGYIHKGVYGAARWLCDRTAECLRQTLAKVAEDSCGSARLVIVGHSLGAGIAAVLAMILADHARELLGVDRAALSCYAFAPPRVVSLDLAMAYSGIVQGIVLQDDFWPRASTSVIAKCFISVLCGVLKANPDGARFEMIVLSQRTFSDHHIRSYQKALDKALWALIAVDPEAVDGFSMDTSDAFRVRSDHVSTASTSSELLSSTIADTATPRA